MKKWLSVKNLGFLAVVGAALLFAGCNQQTGGGGPVDGAVTSVGISVPDGVLTGTVPVAVAVNKDAKLQKIELFADDKKAAEVTITSLQARVTPQGLAYLLDLDTAMLGNDGQPLWQNGQHTIKVVATDKQAHAEEASVTREFENGDYIRGIVVSQDDNPNAPVAVGATDWYGNGDVKVTVDLVNYTGATYELSPSGGGDVAIGVCSAHNIDLTASGGTGTPLSGYYLCSVGTAMPGFATAPTATPVSGEPALVLKKDNNDGFEDDGTLRVTNGPGFIKEAVLGLDDAAPSGFKLTIQKLFDLSPLQNPGTSAFVAPSTKLFRLGGTDSGVGIDSGSFQAVLEYGSPATTVTKGDGDDLADIPESYSGNDITLNKLVLADELGNSEERTSFSGELATLSFDAEPPEVTVTNTPPTSLTAGDTYTLTYTVSDQGGSDFWASYLNLEDGGSYYRVPSTTCTSSPCTANWVAVKLGDGADWTASLALIAIDNAHNYKIFSYSPTVNAADPNDQEAPSVNELTASGTLTAGSGSITLTAKASERPTHTSGSVTFMSFYKQHMKVPQFFNDTGGGSPTTIGGATEDEATSSTIPGSQYPKPGTYGAAVLVRDAHYNATLFTEGSFDVQ